ncbi:MAG: PEP-CTERM sorting domain-containing protein [Microcystis aeruginosa LG13-03]|nr:PEP-CTERM sorting domain-containing protein [Microcystis aeruginosa LG13-13]NCR05230.1 PEP-CTERM sorting domain-containing protein [Microcystis aeruginosa LG13-03]NCR63478.1 PEP-CTERM sorting domain-containing protein [Microcystis aeruginosa LG11-05]
MTSTGDLWSLFTIGEDYSFVYDLLLPPTVSNLRFSLLGGTVTKELRSVPEPTSILGLLALGTIGAASTLKRKLKPSKSAEKETTKVG